jgi:hypothetical protein
VLSTDNLTESGSPDSIIHTGGFDGSAEGVSDLSAIQRDLEELQREQQLRTDARQPNTTVTPQKTVAPTAPAVPTVVTLTQPISLQVAYGSITVQRGTRLPVISRAGADVRIRYLGKEHTIPASVTDLK